MKKAILSILLLVFLSSCLKDAEFADPGVLIGTGIPVCGGAPPATAKTLDGEIVYRQATQQFKVWDYISLPDSVVVSTVVAVSNCEGNVPFTLTVTSTASAGGPLLCQYCATIPIQFD